MLPLSHLVMNRATAFEISRLARHICLIFVLYHSGAIQAQTLQDYEMQVRDIERFGNSYFAAYTNLFSSNFGFSLNQGWSGGAIPKQAGHLSFSLVGSSAIIPINDRNRYIHTSQLYHSANVIASPLTPGMFTDAKGGAINVFLLDPSTNNRLVNPVTGDYLSANFNMIDGIGTEVGVTPFVMPQLSIGLGKSTELSLRVMPFAIGLNEGKVDVSAWGGAIRHSLSQWFSDDDSPNFTVNLLLSYMRNKTTFTPNGERFLTFNNDYFSTAGTSLKLSHQTKTQQALLFFNYRFNSFVEIYGHGGLVRQTSDLGSSGVFKLRINDEYIRDVVDDSSFEYTDLFNSNIRESVAAGGCGMLLGRGFLKGEVQYTYANTHIIALALRATILKGE